MRYFGWLKPVDELECTAAVRTPLCFVDISLNFFFFEQMLALANGSEHVSSFWAGMPYLRKFISSTWLLPA